MNVLVYSGPEVLQVSLKHTVSALRALLSPNYSVQTISQHSLTSHPWSTACALLVFPACRDLFISSSAAAIKAYVESGGAFLAFGTGAHYVSRGSDHPILGLDAKGVAKSLLLRFLDKASGSYLYPIFDSAREPNPRSVAIQLLDGEQAERVFEQSASEFVGLDKGKDVKILARYADDEVAGRIAAVKWDIDRGKVIFWAPNLEYPLAEEPALSTTPSMSTESIALAEQKRRTVLQNTLEILGLVLPSQPVHPATRPLPQFLTAHISRPTAVLQVMEALAAPFPATQLSVLIDTNDTLNFHSFAEGIDVLHESRSGLRADEDPSTSKPKHIIVCRDGELPSRQHVPLFDLALYYSALSLAREKEAYTDLVEPWGFGDVLLYGEVITSTQTMLDKNPRLLSSLPTPFLSLASYQLSGRGRGTNVWLSPSGCLQFSLLLRTSLSALPASKLVFVQYLVGLAVVEACRDETVLGKWGRAVRLKWPNDIYAIVGDGESSRRKVGGILVNTSFTGGKVDIVIGCGLNVLNLPPIMSLSQLLPSDQIHSLSMERTAAVIMAKFEAMWSTFVPQRGSFEPFMQLYLERWLHSDQVVTLTTTVPPKGVRITGITSDHGLLRTIPVRTGWTSGDDGFIDLQPDGNSFDIMAGMIKTKT